MSHDLEIVDISLKDHLNHRMVAWEPKGQVKELEGQFPIPEDIMNALEPYLGDGKGNVSVGAELASSIEFGFKAQAFVSMSVTCDSKLDAMMSVHDILHQTVKQLVEDDHKTVSHIRDDLLAAHKRPAEPTKVSPGPPVKALSRPAGSPLKPNFQR